MISGETWCRHGDDSDDDDDDDGDRHHHHHDHPLARLLSLVC